MPETEPSGVDETPAVEAVSSLPEEALTPEEDLPDWLRGMQAASDLEAALEDPEEQVQPDGLPSWFENLGTSAEVTSAPPEDQAAQPADLPDWLASSTVEAAGESNPPDWFAAEVPTQEPESIPAELSAEDQPETAPDSALPEWLGAFQAESGAQALVEEQPESAPESEAAILPDAAGPFTLETGAPVPEDLAAQPFTTEPVMSLDEGMPDWLKGFQDQPEDQEAAPIEGALEAEPALPAGVDNRPFDVDLPEWLSEKTEPEEAPGSEAAGEAVEGAALPALESELAQADLPSWVQAMRPVETAISGDADLTESEQRVEKAGPLAGLRGILPAEDQVTQYRKPPIYSVKLHVTEKQRTSAAQLDTVLAREVEARPVAQAQSKTSRMIVRVLMGLFMVFVLTAALLMDVQISPPPALYPPELLSMYAQIDAMPSNAPILLAVDYEPGLSGEMQFASTMVIDHLMRKQARMAVISTGPTGPALADQLLAMAAQLNGYDVAANVENLGYLPGGTISLVELANDPRRAAPGTIMGKDAWSGPILKDVATIRDFQRVIVLTDRPDVGRAWVEQVQPFMGDVPLLVVSSAQAAPILEPYVESNQIQGMVSGLMGGALYGQKAGRQDVNLAARYWGAYQVGLLMAFMLVLVGGIVSVLLSLVKRRPQKGKQQEWA